MRCSSLDRRRAKRLSLLCTVFAFTSIAALSFVYQPRTTKASGQTGEAQNLLESPIDKPSAGMGASTIAIDSHHATLEGPHVGSSVNGSDSQNARGQTRFVLSQPTESVDTFEAQNTKTTRSQHIHQRPRQRVTIVTKRATAETLVSEEDREKVQARPRFRSLVTPGRRASANAVPPVVSSTDADIGQIEARQAVAENEPEPATTLDSQLAKQATALEVQRSSATVFASDVPDEPITQAISSSVTEPSDPNIIGWLNIGFSDSSAKNYHIGWNLKSIGWERLIKRRIAPQLEWGTRRVLIHNPFGIRNRNMPMPYDAYLEAQEDGLDWITDGFVEAWRPVVQGQYTNGEPVEVIGYVGAISLDPEMEKLRKAGDMEGWRSRAEASIAPLLEAGMSIAFDAAALLGERHPGYAYMVELKERGVTVYSEAYPPKTRPYLYQFRAIMLTDYARVVRDHHPLYPNRDELAHRTTQLLVKNQQNPNDPHWLRTKTVTILAGGDNVMININWLIDNGYTQQDILDRAEIRRMGIYD